MKLSEMLNRTMKLAMDDGSVDSYEAAEALFNSFKLCVHVKPGFSAIPAMEAAVLTLLNAAPKTFLGGVELIGPADEICTMAWFAEQTLEEVATEFGVRVSSAKCSKAPTIYIGSDCVRDDDVFSLGLTLTTDGFVLAPCKAKPGINESPVEAGVAAAGVALCEAFQFVYGKAPLAGHREIRWTLPSRNRSARHESLWLIGLGHLGQAFLWATALAGAGRLPRVVRLTDNDIVSASSLSTCLLVSENDVGRMKVDVVAERLCQLGIDVQRDYERLDLDLDVTESKQDLVVVAVDNLSLRRSLDHLRAKRVLEAGIGDGIDAFTRIQAHSFPGPRKARDIWIGNDVRASSAVDLTLPAYQRLLTTSGDRCGTALVAGRSVATPFIGAFAGALLSSLSSDDCSTAYSWNFDVANL